MIAKQNIVKSDFIWHSQNINEHHKLGNFDLILLSNIADYSHKIFPGDNHTIDYKNNIVMPWLSHLKDYRKSIMVRYSQ
jgi:hypothetical protein